MRSCSLVLEEACKRRKPKTFTSCPTSEKLHLYVAIPSTLPPTCYWWKILNFFCEVCWILWFLTRAQGLTQVMLQRGRRSRVICLPWGLSFNLASLGWRCWKALNTVASARILVTVTAALMNLAILNGLNEFGRWFCFISKKVTYWLLYQAFP